MRFPPLASVLLVTATLFLAGCETAEQRAERYYQSGLQLLEAGDVDRALIEFRNVFDLNGQHKEARLVYARIQRERGAISESLGQYLRLLEQYPDTLEARLAVAEMAIDIGNWEEAERHGRAARELAPTDPKIITINTALDYRKASLDQNGPAMTAAVNEARKQLEADPKNQLARRIVVDDLMTKGDSRAALPEVQAGLAIDPANYAFQMIRLQILGEMGDNAATGAALEEMFVQFPNNQDVRGMLIAWYMTENDLAGAEDFLRRLATAPEGDMNDKLAVVEFLRQTKGNEAAKGELDALIAAEPDRKTYKALRSSIIYEEGDTATAIADMEALLTNAESDDETRNLKVTLARMLALSNDKVGARARVEEVIAEDPNHVEALKMQAGWLIDEDKPTEAILALRTALSQAPRDVSVITMMGQAHEREGARDLAGERYALAVEVSGRAPAESLRYASFLMADERMESAEAVLEDALQANPENVELISAMAEIKIRLRDWDSVTRSVWKLRSLETDPATAAANAIEAASLLQQERVEETLDFLGDLVQSEDSSVAAKAQMVQVQVRAGKLDEARDFLDSELAKAPDEPTLLYLRAGLHVLQNEPDQAETLYRKLIETQPQFDRPMYTLYGLMMGQGRTDDADALIDAALVSNPDNETALLMKAGRLEQRQDFNGAIEVYEKLYARDSSNLIVANNLASLITTHRADDASLERGYSIARRLKGSDVPAFQDTYGWIEYRRGNYEEALANLEPAAKGLPNDPLAQFHLGMTYLALNRKDEARATLEQALKIAGDSPLPQFDEARAELAKLGGN